MSAILLRSLAAAGAILICCAAPAMGASSRLGALRIDNPWARPTPPGAPTGAGYLTVTNTGKTADRLMGGASPLAERVEVHTVSMTGNVMRMRAMPEGAEIGPGKTLSLAPGGSHLMLVGVKQRIRPGDRIPVTLKFAKAGEVKVEFVAQMAPPPPAHGAH